MAIDPRAEELDDYIECIGCGNVVSKDEADNGYCIECLEDRDECDIDDDIEAELNDDLL